MHLAVMAGALASVAAIEAFQHFQLGVVDRVGVVVHARTADERLAADPVEFLHLEWLRLHHVDRAFVQGECGR